jgi:hypothetical protein
VRDRLAGAVFASVEAEAEGSPIGGGLPPQIQPHGVETVCFMTDLSSGIKAHVIFRNYLTVIGIVIPSGRCLLI